MKRFLIILLILCLTLSGCGIFSERITEPVTFYYLKAEYQFGQNSSVIVTEQREAAGHRDDLSYLLALYLMGPSEEEHVTPLPAGTRFIKLKQENAVVSMELSEASHALSDIDFSLACACIAMTCLDITDAKSVSITSADRTITMTRESLMLLDDSAANSVTEDTQ